MVDQQVVSSVVYRTLRHTSLKHNKTKLSFPVTVQMLSNVRMNWGVNLLIHFFVFLFQQILKCLKFEEWTHADLACFSQYCRRNSSAIVCFTQTKQIAIVNAREIFTFIVIILGFHGWILNSFDNLILRWIYLQSLLWINIFLLYRQVVRKFNYLSCTSFRTQYNNILDHVKLKVKLKFKKIIILLYPIFQNI